MSVQFARDFLRPTNLKIGMGLLSVNRLSDAQLMSLVAEGVQTACDELFRRYHALLLNYARRNLVDKNCAEDVVQETFLRVVKAARRYNSGLPFRPWLFAIAHNEVRRQWHRSKRAAYKPLSAPLDDWSGLTLETVLADSRPAAEVEMFLQKISRRIWELVEELPDFQRIAMQLRLRDGLSLKEIAEKTGSNVATVSSRLHYAQEKVRKAMIGAEFVPSS